MLTLRSKLHAQAIKVYSTQIRPRKRLVLFDMKFKIYEIKVITTSISSPLSYYCKKEIFGLCGLQISQFSRHVWYRFVVFESVNHDFPIGVQNRSQGH